MSEFKDRLAEAMNIRDISAAELSRISGVNEGAVVSTVQENIKHPSAAWTNLPVL